MSPVSGESECLCPGSTAFLHIGHSTPKKVQSQSACTGSNVPAEVQGQTSCGVSSSTVVTVKLQWPSQTRERHLPEDLQPLGKMLARGTYKQIANAVWNNPILRKQLQILAVKHVDKECHSLCSKTNPSCLQSPNKDALLNFSFEKLQKELEQRAPFIHAILQTSCVNKRNAEKRSEWVPSVGMAAAIILRNKSSRLNAVQLLLSIFLYHSSWSVCIHEY